jgi:hypothetical protein
MRIGMQCSRFQSGKPRLKCKVCGFQFVAVRSHKPDWMKEMALTLYQSRMTIRGIAKVLKVSPPTVLSWLRTLGPKIVEKPAVEKVRAIQIDEVWHYLGEKNEKSGFGWLLILIQSESLTGKSAIVAQLP